MKKRIFAFLLAALMLVGLCLAGCGEKELTAEEYLRASINADIKAAQKTPDFDSAKLSVGVGNIGYLLDFMQVDTDGMPAIDDILLDICGNTDGNANIALSALVNDAECNFNVGFNAEQLTFVLASNLMKGTYGISIDDVMENAGLDLDELPFMDTEAVEALVNDVLGYAEPITDLLVANSTLTKTEGEKGKVVVTMEMNAAQYANFAMGILDLIRNDTVIADFFKAYDIDLEEELFEDYDEYKDEIPAEFEELGMSMKMDLTINKKTYVAEEASGIITIDGETITMSAVETDGNMAISMEMMDVVLDFSATYDDKNCNASFKMEYDGEEINVDLTAENGKAKLELDVDGYDEISASISGDYTVGKNKFELLLTEVEVSGLAIDLSEAEITVSYETNCDVPAVSAPDEMITDFTEDGPLFTIMQEIAINFMAKTGMFAY